jgi:hypothetical protein
VGFSTVRSLPEAIFEFLEVDWRGYDRDVTFDVRSWHDPRG